MYSTLLNQVVWHRASQRAGRRACAERMAQGVRDTRWGAERSNWQRVGRKACVAGHGAQGAAGWQQVCSTFFYWVVCRRASRQAGRRVYAEDVRGTLARLHMCTAHFWNALCLHLHLFAYLHETVHVQLSAAQCNNTLLHRAVRRDWHAALHGCGKGTVIGIWWYLACRGWLEVAMDMQGE